MAAIDDLNAEISALTASVNNLIAAYQAANTGGSNDAAIEAATSTLKSLQSTVDAALTPSAQ